MPDYEIKVWNEENFDVNMVPYIQEAYKARKYAFVSDYARFWILYNYGGLYFDTDVEIIKSLDEIISQGPFMGCEQDYIPMSNGTVLRGEGSAVNPGLGIAAFAGMDFYKEVLDMYSSIHFFHADGSTNEKTIVAYITEMLTSKGLLCNQLIQNVAGITIYPQEYFGPKDYVTGELHITENTHSIHHYDASWRDKSMMARVTYMVKNFFLKFLPSSWVNKILELKQRKRKTGSYLGS